MPREVITELSIPLVVCYEKDSVVQYEEGHGRHNLSGTYRVMQSVKVYIGNYCIDITDNINSGIEEQIWQQIKDLEDGI